MTIFVVLFSYFAFTLLAPWQLNKDHDIAQRNEQIEAAFAADPVPVAQAVNPDGTMKSEWTRVTLTGTYVADSEVLLRLRPVASGPTYQSLIAFKDESGLTMLVDRGWVAAGEANSVPDIPAPPSQTVTITGVLRAAERTANASQPITDQGYQQVYVINPSQVGSLVNLPMTGDYVQLASADIPGVLNPIPIPQLDRGSHLSYGFQWIAFGIMAPLGLGYFVWAELRERRRARDEQAELAAASSTATTPAAPPQPPTATQEQAQAQPQAQAQADSPADAPAPQPAPSRRRGARYGDARPDFYSKLGDRDAERFD